MKCGDRRCTGNHNDRKFDTLCPRSKENKLASARRWYGRQSNYEHARKVLSTRRLKALQRIERRRMRGEVQE